MLADRNGHLTSSSFYAGRLRLVFQIRREAHLPMIKLLQTVQGLVATSCRYRAILIRFASSRSPPATLLIALQLPFGVLQLFAFRRLVPLLRTENWHAMEGTTPQKKRALRPSHRLLNLIA